MRERKFGRRVGVTSLVALCAHRRVRGDRWHRACRGARKSRSAQYGAGGQYHGKVTICHKGHVTIRVAMVAWVRAHQRHGDTMGPCSAAAVKAAKVKAAKLKARPQRATPSFRRWPRRTLPRPRPARMARTARPTVTRGRSSPRRRSDVSQGASAPAATHGPPPGHGTATGTARTAEDVRVCRAATARHTPQVVSTGCVLPAGTTTQPSNERSL